MARVIDGRYGADGRALRGIHLRDVASVSQRPCSIDRRMIRARSTEVLNNVPTVQPDWETIPMVQVEPGSRETRGCT